MTATFIVYTGWNLDTAEQQWSWKIAVRGRFTIHAVRSYATERGARRAALRTIRALRLNRPAQQTAFET